VISECRINLYTYDSKPWQNIIFSHRRDTVYIFKRQARFTFLRFLSSLENSDEYTRVQNLRRWDTCSALLGIWYSALGLASGVSAEHTHRESRWEIYNSTPDIWYTPYIRMYVHVDVLYLYSAKMKRAPHHHRATVSILNQPE
jgi:hypothetical protein